MTPLKPAAETIIIKWRGKQNYFAMWQDMQRFTKDRTSETLDEIWLLEHEPVFTQGQNGKAEHILDAGNIPIIQSDRGGQVTYHGPGQLMIYTLIDLRRKQLNVHELVTRLLQVVINFLKDQGIAAQSQCHAPGVYVNEKKIASIGLRIRRGCSYHGIAFNIDLDLAPFKRIHPCGFSGLKMTQLTECLQNTSHTFLSAINIKAIGQQLIPFLMKNLGYTNANFVPNNDSE